MLSLLKSDGMMAQLPIKVLFEVSKRQIHGNSPGLASAYSRSSAFVNALVPQALLPGLKVSLQPWTQDVVKTDNNNECQYVNLQ